MVNRPIFVVSRLDRKAEFALNTCIYVNGAGQKYVVKQPADGYFSAHFNSIFEAPEKLEPLSKGRYPIKIIKPTPMGGAVMFPFVRGKSVERIMLDKVLANDEQAVLKIIKRFVVALDKLPSTKCIPTNDSQYKKIFGNSFDKRVECIVPGIVDLNLDNLIEDKDGVWHLVDYEWTFDFPVPKDYLLGRMLLAFFILRYQPLIRNLAARIEQVEVGKSHSMPAYVADKYDKWIRIFPEVLATESHFQSYVLKREESLGGFSYIPKERRNKVEPPAQLIDDYMGTQQSNRELKDRNQQLSDELKNIRNSRTYKTALKLSELKNKAGNIKKKN